MANAENGKADNPFFTGTQRRYLIQLAKGEDCAGVAAEYGVFPQSVQNTLTDILARTGQTGNTFLYPLVFALRTREILPSEILPQELDVTATLQAVRDNGLAKTVKEILGSPKDGAMLGPKILMNDYKRKLRKLREMLGATSSSHALGMCEAMLHIMPNGLDPDTEETLAVVADQQVLGEESAETEAVLSKWNPEQGLGVEELFRMVEDPDMHAFMAIKAIGGELYSNIIAIAPNKNALINLVGEHSPNGDVLRIVQTLLKSEEYITNGELRYAAFNRFTMPDVVAKALRGRIGRSNLGEEEKERMFAFLDSVGELDIGHARHASYSA